MASSPQTVYSNDIYLDSDQKDSGFSEDYDFYQTHEQSPPLDCDEVDSIRRARRGASTPSKNNDEAVQNKMRDSSPTGRAQCGARDRPAADFNASQELFEDCQTEEGAEMSAPRPADCREAADHCEDKLLRLKNLLSQKGDSPSKSTKIVKSSVNIHVSGYQAKTRSRRLFVEPKSVTVENCDVPFAADTFACMESVMTIKFINPGLIAESELVRVEALPKVQLVHVPPKVEALAEIKACDGKVEKSVDIAKTIPAKVVAHPQCSLKNINKAQTVVVASDGDTMLPADETTNVTSDVHNEASASNAKVAAATIDLPRDTRAAGEITTAESKNSDSAVTSDRKLLISTCEDKVSRLKALLAERRKSRESKGANLSGDSSLESARGSASRCRGDREECEMKMDTNKSRDRPVPAKRRVGDKRHKNPNRLGAHDQRRKQLRRSIVEDMTFATEIDGVEFDFDSPTIRVSPPDVAQEMSSSVDSRQSESDCEFDEVRGRFRKSSASGSEDSFTIVFTDSPTKSSPSASPRSRLPSDCGSEDSFTICFEDEDGANPDCFTSADVFDSEASDSETDSSDSESLCSESDSVFSDSGHGKSNLISCSFGNSMSRTISDLTDESLYLEEGETLEGAGSGDEVDCAVSARRVDGSVEELPKQSGLLVDERRKLAKRRLPAKKVRFSEKPSRVHVLRVWAFAARQARAGHWERFVIDRDRFKRRIADVDMAISWVLKPQHRARVKFQRFMPWWHAQKRKEDAEKKEREEQDRLQTELEADALTNSVGDVTKESDVDVGMDAKSEKVNSNCDSEDLVNGKDCENLPTMGTVKIDVENGIDGNLVAFDGVVCGKTIKDENIDGVKESEPLR